MLHQGHWRNDIAIQSQNASVLGHALLLHIVQLCVDVFQLLLCVFLLQFRLRGITILWLEALLIWIIVEISLKCTFACFVGGARIPVQVLVFLLKTVVRPELEERAHHVHHLSASLLQLRDLAVQILDVHDVTEDLADGLAEPPKFC